MRFYVKEFKRNEKKTCDPLEKERKCETRLPIIYKFIQANEFSFFDHGSRCQKVIFSRLMTKIDVE